jgi:hypothetical protein
MLFVGIQLVPFTSSLFVGCLPYGDVSQNELCCETAATLDLGYIFSVIEELIFRLPLRHSAINLTISALLFAFFSLGSLLLKFGSFGLTTAKERLLWGSNVCDIGSICCIRPAADRAC